MGALLRLKWVIIGLTAVGSIAGVALSRFVAPVYEAQATIQIASAGRGGGGGGAPIQGAQLLESFAWIDLMRSYQVLDEVVRRRRLFLEPANAADSSVFRDFQLDTIFTPATFELVREGGTLRLLNAEGVEVERVAVGDSVGRSRGFRWVPDGVRDGATVRFRVRTPRDASVRLNDVLQTRIPPENASFLRMALRGTDARATAATLNQIADRFVEVATQQKREKLTDYRVVLSDQLAKAQADLRNAESALESWKINTITLPSDRGATPIASGLQETRDPVRQAFFQLRIDRESKARERDAILRALDSRSDTSSLVISLGVIPAVRDAAELSATLTDLGAKRAEARRLALAFNESHPPLRRLEQEIQELETLTVPRQARALAASLSEQIREFDQRIAASSREMQQIPARATEEARRESSVEIARSLYTQLREAYEQAALAELSAAPDVRVLDVAVPPTRPVADQMLIILVGGAFGGFGLGVVLALLLDRFDRRIRYPDQVTRGLGLGILGAIPRLEKDARGQATVDSAAHLQESLRAVRVALTYAHGTAGKFVTTVTSPGPGDGKSFVSQHLARSFAAAGHRVLLIDGDTRRGTLHKALGGHRRPGLLDVLSGANALDEVIQQVPERGFDFIGGGTRRAGGPELLASSAMQRLMQEVRGRYSAIILDSPPLGAGVDPLVLSSVSGTMLLVLRTGVTDGELAGAKLADLQRLPIRVLGAVLNDVRTQGVYRYYSYLPGYGAEEEREEPAPRRSGERERPAITGRG